MIVSRPAGTRRACPPAARPSRAARRSCLLCFGRETTPLPQGALRVWSRPVPSGYSLRPLAPAPAGPARFRLPPGTAGGDPSRRPLCHAEERSDEASSVGAWRRGGRRSFASLRMTFSLPCHPEERQRRRIFFRRLSVGRKKILRFAQDDRGAGAGCSACRLQAARLKVSTGRF